MQLVLQGFHCQQYHEYSQLDMIYDHVCDLHYDCEDGYEQFRLSVHEDEYVLALRCFDL